MSHGHHISTQYSVVLKASKTLNFIKQNLYMCSKEVKEAAYLTLVRPCLEYASSVWDPYQLYLIYLISSIEKIQRRAARWTLSDYNRYSSVSNMLKQLQWSSLEMQRSDPHLCMLYR